MQIGMGMGIGTPAAGGAEPETALSTVPSSVTRAVLSEHFTFTGTTLTGFTTDLFGNSANSVRVGSPQQGPNGGYISSAATTTSNYVYTTLSEVSGAFPSGRHVSLCYRKTGADESGLFIGAATIDSFAGAAINGNNDTVTVFGNSTCRAFRGRRGSDGAEVDLQRGSTTRNQLFDNLYPNTLIDDINAICFEDLRMADNGGRCYWGRYVDGTAIHLNAEILGWAVCTDQTQIEAVNDWLIRWAPSA